MPNASHRLVLASTSPYRRQLLERLTPRFSIAAPHCDETPYPAETAAALVQRLAIAKAEAVAPDYPHHLIIGSDQAAVCGNQILGKPDHHARAVQQLTALSGQSVEFLTGLCLLDSHLHKRWSAVVPYRVQMRDLTAKEIEAYLRAEQPYDCAGSFKSEGLGVYLFERMEGEDPNALIGLPLIRLCHWLREAGYTEILQMHT